MLELLNTIALALGYLFLFALSAAVTAAVGKPILSYALWRDSSDEAKQIGAQMKEEHGYDSGLSAMLAGQMLDAIDDLPDGHIEYEPAPLVQLDWSLDSPPSTELNVIKSALADAGYYVHPFPREREGEWSKASAGVWEREPNWYVQDESGERVEVTPDTQEWQVASPHDSHL